MEDIQDVANLPNLDNNTFNNEIDIDDDDIGAEKCQVAIMGEPAAESQQVAALIQAIEKMRVEFDTQRAKLKELFLHKEEELQIMKKEKDAMGKLVENVTAELNEVKSQLLVAGLQLESNVETEKRKAAEEIASLQQFVQETVDESSTSRIEVRKLQAIIQHLEVQIQDLKQHSPHHTAQESPLAPSVVLSAVTKKIGKKLGTDFFTTQDDDHKDDHELLKTLIGPLEEEIKALKDKLRATDDELQKYKHPGDGNASVPKEIQKHCDMCRNYEDELVGEQKRVALLETKVLTAEKSAERHKEDLLKEIGFRKDMEEKWNEKKEEHKKLVAELTTRLECTEQDLKEMSDFCQNACENMRDSLGSLTNEREMVQKELERLQKENDNLVGKYSMHSQVLQNEFIDLPNTVEELQEAILKIQQELIIAKIGKEAAEEEKDNLRGEIILLKDQISSDQQTAKELECTLVTEMEQMKMQKDKLEFERKGYIGSLDKYKSREKDTIAKLQANNAELENTLEVKKTLEMKNQELRSRVASLQHELDTSETVQKDFVRLSQNLQVQLEKIREADTQVRWQHDDDIDECPMCRNGFTANRRKEHCRHCGQIFCVGCLTHVVHSGPNQQPSKVCDVCHTLLVKSSAPYFSTEAPHSPD